MPHAPKSYAAILDHITHFLTVAIHMILSICNVYPTNSFITARAYNYPVRQSRHPGVCAWINAAVAAVHAELLKGTIARAVLAIAHPQTCKVLERYVFEMTRLPDVSREDLKTPIVRGNAPAPPMDDLEPDEAFEDPRSPGGAREHELADLTEQLRGTLSAISACRQRLKPVPAGCTFTIAIELKDDADPPVGHPQPWVPVQPEVQRLKKGSRAGSGEDVDNDLYSVSQVDSSTARKHTEHVGTGLAGKVLPMRAIDTDEMALEVWVEEGRSKSELTESDFGRSAESSGQAVS